MHADDAKARGIKEGDIVRVYNSRGSCLASVVLNDALSPGVAKLSCGAWYDPVDGDEGALCAHGNANILTHDRGTSKLSQGPSTGTNMVEIEGCTAAAGRSRSNASRYCRRCAPFEPSVRRWWSRGS
jgi:biotin/methionine sulfoxide reductase